MTYRGKLVRVDLGTGGWVLETKSGEKIALYGDVPSALAGRQVHVDGDELDGAGFMMVGDKMVQVSEVREAP
ncbi:MAG: hypothetical protein ABMB14_12695 [Myxococcota bacterium]